MSPPITDWLVAFVWTLALEQPVYWLLLRDRFPTRWWAPAAIVLVVNSVTHPALWYLAPYFEPYWSWLLVCESAVVLVETLLVRAAVGVLSGPRGAWGLAAASALAANVGSTVIGMLLLR